MEDINSWSKRAKCRGRIDIDFFPNGSSPKAKKFCKGLDGGIKCPVLDLCKTYAIVHDEQGVWGGTCYADRTGISSFIVGLIRQVYYQSGLLESRPSLPSVPDPQSLLLEALEHQAEQQQGLFSPSAPKDLSQDPNLDLSA